MLAHPGDTVRGKDGHDWVVLTVDGEVVTIWREGAGTWTGKPSAPLDIVKMPEEDAVIALMSQFDLTALSKARGATIAHLTGQRLLRQHQQPQVAHLIESSRGYREERR